MDTEMKRTLGGALIGALLLVTGLMLSQSESGVVLGLAGVAMLGGGLVAFLCIAKVAVALLRSEG